MKNLFSQEDISTEILSTIEALVVILDRQGRIVGFNRACEKLSGYSFDEVNGKYIGDLFLVPEEKPAVMQVISVMKAGEFPTQHKNYWQTRSGEKRWIVWNNSAMLDGSGNVEYIIGTGIDSTEQKKIQDELRELNLALEKKVLERTLILEETNETMASLISQLEKKDSELRANIIRSLPHEFLTPLSVILGFSDLLLIKSAELSPQQVNQFALDIHHSAGRLLRMVKNFLFYTELEVTLSDPTKVAHQRKAALNLDPEEVGQFALIKLGEVNRQNQLRWVLQPVRLAIAETHFHKLLEEILDNAAKYSRPDTIIEVTGRVILQNKIYRLSVTDLGRGMTEKQIQAVAGLMQFDRFVYEQQGIGMGLVISRRIVDIYGGVIKFTSTPGTRTRVDIDLPLA